MKPKANLIPALIEATIARYISPETRVVQVERLPMADQERGWSGAEVRRYRATLDQGDTMMFILKTASLKERRVMTRLTEQGHTNVPYTFASDLMSPGDAWLCMQDVAADGSGPSDLLQQVARGLAAIHMDNLGRMDDVPWLPRADTAYFRDFLVAQVWRDNWETQMARYPEFAAEFGHYTPRLDAAAQQFIAAMDSLWHEGDSLTITHGDLHPQDGSHVVVHRGRPYFIDWGWAYYGSFYLDLPNVFTRETVVYYRDALAELGHDVPMAEFLARCDDVNRYVGFKYLCSGIWQWPPGPTHQTGRMLLQMLKRAIDGEFPESAFNYSDVLFARLLAEHQRSRV